MSPSPPRKRTTPARSRKAASKTGAPTAGVPPPARKLTRTHHLVPPHELLSEEETRQTLQALGTSIERLPKILYNDPGLETDAKFRAAREAKEPLQGRLVRVRRPSPTAGEAVAYRVIIGRVGD